MRTYLDSIRRDGVGLAAAVRSGRLDAPVPSCPGWDLRDLAEHVGHVQRRARLAALTAAPPVDADIEPPPPGDRAPNDADPLADWLAAGSADLVEALAELPDDAPTWHPFPVPKVAGVWPRRQAHEVAIHRWDAEKAVGPTARLDRHLAADFVREYFEVIVPRVMDRDGRVPPVGDLDVHLTDTGDHFLVRSTTTTVAIVSPGPSGGGARLTGTSASVLLALWRRSAVPNTPMSGPAAAWLAFGGN